MTAPLLASKPAAMAAVCGGRLLQLVRSAALCVAATAYGGCVCVLAAAPVARVLQRQLVLASGCWDGWCELASGGMARHTMRPVMMWWRLGRRRVRGLCQGLLCLWQWSSRQSCVPGAMAMSVGGGGDGADNNGADD